MALSGRRAGCNGSAKRTGARAIAPVHPGPSLPRQMERLMSDIAPPRLSPLLFSPQEVEGWLTSFWRPPDPDILAFARRLPAKLQAAFAAGVACLHGVDK